MRMKEVRASGVSLVSSDANHLWSRNETLNDLTNIRYP